MSDVINLEVTAYGSRGEKGDAGISAYEVAVAEGFVGTESEWLASLVGADATATTDAGELVSGTLPIDRIADGSVTKAKLETTVQDSLNLADTSVQPSEITGIATLEASQDAQDIAIALNTAKVTYPAADALKVFNLPANQNSVNSDFESRVSVNDAKVGITTQQANDITANNAKISYPTTASDKLDTIETNAKDDQIASEIPVNNTGRSIIADATDQEDYNNKNDAALLKARNTIVTRGSGVGSVVGGTGVGTTFSISSGEGEIFYPTYRTISWTTKTGVTPISNGLVWVYFDDNTNTLKQTTTEPTQLDRIGRLYLQRFSVTNGIITGLTPEMNLPQPANTLANLARADKLKRDNGVVPAASGTGFQVSAGSIFGYAINYNENPFDSDLKTLTLFNTATGSFFRYATSTGVIPTDVSVINTNLYQTGGVTATLTNNRWGANYIWVFPSVPNYRVVYGFSNASNSATVINALPTNKDIAAPASFENAFCIGAIVFQKGSTSDTWIFVPTNNSGNFGGAIATANTSAYPIISNNLSEFTATAPTVLNNLGKIDDDTFATATANNFPSAESVKAYVDTKNIPEGYVSPRSYGAVMDGVTDDRTAFVATLADADLLGKKVWIDRDIKLDFSAFSDDTIFLNSNVWVEGTPNQPKILINNVASPAFVSVFTTNTTFKNVDFVFDGSYDAANISPAGTYDDNIATLKAYLETNHNIVFTGGILPKRGSEFFATFLLEGAENVLFDNVGFKAAGDTANEFMLFAVVMQEQFSPNQTVSADTDPVTISKNVTLNNVVFDGVLMGVQGMVNGFTSDNVVSYRYSDAQTEAGGSIGGNDGANNYWMPPPHLYYFIDGSDEKSNNVKVLNTVDYGEYVGAVGVRATASGYCNSLKVTGTDNVIVDNYKSYRRDGLGDLGSITNGKFNNIYSESKSDIFNQSFNFIPLRFVGPLVDVEFNNMIIKDTSPSIGLYPMGGFDGNYVTMKDVHIYVNTFTATVSGGFGLTSGSNNRITNSGINIKNHTSTQTFRGMVFNQTAAINSGANNYFDVYVKGWRIIDSDPAGLAPRVLFHSTVNPNKNYCRITDVNNNLIIEERNGIIKHNWTRSETKTLPTSGTSTSFTITVPRYYAARTFYQETHTALASGTMTLGFTGNQAFWIPNVLEATGIIRHQKNELIGSSSGNRNIVLYTDSAFASGVIKVTVELERIFSEGSGVDALTASTQE